MRRYLRYALVLILFMPLTAVASGSTYWEVWRAARWQQMVPPYPTDGKRPQWRKDGAIVCDGVLRRYVVRTHRNVGGQCVITTDYTYYCRRMAGTRAVVSAERAPSSGPTVSCE